MTSDIIRCKDQRGGWVMLFNVTFTIFQ